MGVWLFVYVVIRSYLWQYGYLKVVSGIILKYRENSRYRGANRCNVLKYGVIYIELFAGSVVLWGEWGIMIRDDVGFVCLVWNIWNKLTV